MNKDQIKNIIFLIISIFLAIIAINFILWLLPIIFIAILAYFIYKHLRVKKEEKKANAKVITDDKYKKK